MFAGSGTTLGMLPVMSAAGTLGGNAAGHGGIILWAGPVAGAAVIVRSLALDECGGGWQLELVNATRAVAIAAETLPGVAPLKNAIALLISVNGRFFTRLPSSWQGISGKSYADTVRAARAQPAAAKSPEWNRFRLPLERAIGPLAMRLRLLLSIVSVNTARPNSESMTSPGLIPSKFTKTASKNAAKGLK